MLQIKIKYKQKHIRAYDNTERNEAYKISLSDFFG